MKWKRGSSWDCYSYLLREKDAIAVNYFMKKMGKSTEYITVLLFAPLKAAFAKCKPAAYLWQDYE